MSSRPVISISARNRGTTRFLIGSTPSTWRASSSSRIFRAPRSAVIAVPATPATTTAVTNGANSRIEARTKNPPSRSSAPNSDRKLAAWSPGAPNPNATVEISNGNQVSWSANRNWPMNSPPYGYGGLTVETIVFPVRIIMFPTCSNRDLAGRKALSATLLTISQPDDSRRVGRRSSWTARRDLDPPPAHKRADRAVTRGHVPGLAPGLSQVLVGDPLPLVLLGLARHRLDLLAGAALAAGPPRLFVPGLGELLEQAGGRAPRARPAG